MSKISQTNIRRLARKYKTWLINQQWFNLNIKDKDSWLVPIDGIINKSINSPALLWEAVVDHWQASSWHEDSFPALFEALYDMVDEYRSAHSVDGTDNVNLLVDALKKSDNQAMSPQAVISMLYEKLTGVELFRATDLDNGEDYEYKHNPEECKASVALHQDVSDYFGFKSKYLRIGEIPLFCRNLKNHQIAVEIRAHQHALLW
jgi:hypothetical protein